MTDPRISLVKGDITKLKVDAIVNAANNSLMGGGGVDGAIHKAGGPEILAACKVICSKQGGCETGEAVITGGGKLPARHVIHTVGPVWHGGFQGEEELLASCYRNSLMLARLSRIRTLAFPNISTGVYGFPKPLAAQVAVREVTEFLKTCPEITGVTFVCYDDENYSLYKTLLSV